MQTLNQFFIWREDDKKRFEILINKTKLNLFFKRKLSEEFEEDHEILDDIFDLCEINWVSDLPNYYKFNDLIKLNFLQIYILFVWKKVDEILNIDYFTEQLKTNKNTQIQESINNPISLQIVLLKNLFKKQIDEINQVNCTNKNKKLQKFWNWNVVNKIQEFEEKEIFIENWSLIDFILYQISKNNNPTLFIQDILEWKSKNKFAKNSNTSINIQCDILIDISIDLYKLLNNLNYNWDDFCISFWKIFLKINPEIFNNPDLSKKYFEIINKILYKISIWDIENKEDIINEFIKFENQFYEEKIKIIENINTKKLNEFIDYIINNEEKWFNKLYEILKNIDIDFFKVNSINEVDFWDIKIKWTAVLYNFWNKLFSLNWRLNDTHWNIYLSVINTLLILIKVWKIKSLKEFEEKFNIYINWNENLTDYLYKLYYNKKDWIFNIKKIIISLWENPQDNYKEIEINWKKEKISEIFSTLCEIMFWLNNDEINNKLSNISNIFKKIKNWNITNTKQIKL